MQSEIEFLKMMPIKSKDSNHLNVSFGNLIIEVGQHCYQRFPQDFTLFLFYLLIRLNHLKAERLFDSYIML